MARVFHQAGAIPYRTENGMVEVLLISTSSGKNLTIPKGLIDPGFSATETAVNEAYEEAGIRGRLLSPSIGSYGFEKWGGRCEVIVFAMAVTRELQRWPEDVMRRRIWKTITIAAQGVKHADLGDLILKLPAWLNLPPARF
ncbi:MAG: NUDIX hydrolase [Desulfosarcina sp.]|jgi:phosphohistidine phosphatase